MNGQVCVHAVHDTHAVYVQVQVTCPCVRVLIMKSHLTGCCASIQFGWSADTGEHSRTQSVQIDRDADLMHLLTEQHWMQRGKNPKLRESVIKRRSASVCKPFSVMIFRMCHLILNTYVCIVETKVRRRFPAEHARSDQSVAGSCAAKFAGQTILNTAVLHGKCQASAERIITSQFKACIYNTCCIGTMALERLVAGRGSFPWLD
jgi:hypothetical protein